MSAALEKVGLSFVIGAQLGKSVTSNFNSVKTSLTDIHGEIKSLAKERLNINEKLKSNVGEQVQLKNRLSQINSEMRKLKAVNNVNLIFKSNVEKIRTELKDLGKIAAGVTVATGTIGALVNSYQDLAQAQGEISSLGIGEKGIAAITKAAKEFSGEWAGSTAPEFIRASYDIKSGISSLTDEGVAEFTKLAALTGTATKATTADMTKLFALGYGIFREQFIDDKDFANQFSNAISASVMAFRTDGPDLINGISALGASAAAKGVSLAEQLAILGVSKGAYDSASEAATGYNALLAGIGGAQEALGLKFTDAEGKMLPMTEILTEIKNKFGDTFGTVETQDAIKKAFGSDEAVKSLAYLVNNIDALAESQKLLESEMASGTKTAEMAQAIQRGKEFQLLGQQLKNLAQSVGEVFAPAFGVFAKVIGSVSKGLSVFTENNQGLVKTISYVIGGFVSYVAIVKSLTIAKAALAAVSAFTTAQALLMGGAYKKITLVTKASSVAQWGLNAAMTANPIGLVVVGVAALIGVVVALYKNWDKVTRFFSVTWEKIKSLFSSGSNVVKNSFGSAVEFVKNGAMGIVNFYAKVWSNIFNFVGNVVSNIYTNVTNVFSNVFNFITELPSKIFDFYKSVFSTVTDFVGSVIPNITDKLLVPLNAAKKAFSSVKGWIFGDDEEINEDNNVTKDINKNLTSNVNLKSAPKISDDYYGKNGVVTNNAANNNQSVSYSPQITIKGNANKEDVQEALKINQEEFDRMLKRSNLNNNRLAFVG